MNQFGAEIVRALKPGGYVMSWWDKFIRCQGTATGFLQNKSKLVHLATWDKRKIGMGSAPGEDVSTPYSSRKRRTSFA